MISREQLLGRWQSLAARERSILIAGAGILAVIVVYLLLEPVLENRNRLQADIPRLREELTWMQSHVPELQRLLGSGVNVRRGEPLSVALVEDLLRQSGIHEQVSELRPVDTSVSLRFEKVSHAQLMHFLSALTTRSSAQVGLAGIRRLETPAGHVEASLTLKPDSGS